MSPTSPARHRRQSVWPSSSAGAPMSLRCLWGVRRSVVPISSRLSATTTCSARTSTPSSTAWRWTSPRTSGRPTGDPRPLLRPGRERGRPAVGPRLRHGRSSRAKRSPIISAARCSSPTSCATSTRTRRSGRLYLPREALQSAGIEHRRSARRRSPIRRSTAACARGRRLAHGAFRRGARRSWRAAARRAVARAASSWPRSMARSSRDGRASGFAPPRSGCAARQAAHARWSCLRYGLFS